MQVVIEEEEGGNSTWTLLVDESRIIPDTRAQKIIHPPPPVTNPCTDTLVNNTVHQHHTVSPVNNRDGDVLKLRSALYEVS